MLISVIKNSAIVDYGLHFVVALNWVWFGASWLENNSKSGLLKINEQTPLWGFVLSGLDL